MRALVRPLGVCMCACARVLRCLVPCCMCCQQCTGRMHGGTSLNVLTLHASFSSGVRSGNVAVVLGPILAGRAFIIDTGFLQRLPRDLQTGRVLRFPERALPPTGKAFSCAPELYGQAYLRRAPEDVDAIKVRPTVVGVDCLVGRLVDCWLEEWGLMLTLASALRSLSVGVFSSDCVWCHMHLRWLFHDLVIVTQQAARTHVT